MKEIGMTIDSNNLSKPKGAGYYLHRVGVIMSLFFIAYSAFAIVNTLMDIGRHGNASGHLFKACVYLAIDVLLIGYVSRAFRSTKLRKLVTSMKNPHLFQPNAGEDQFAAAQNVYHGVDLRHRTVGVASVYESGANRRKRLMFDADTIESYELRGNVLILNLRNTQIPSISIMTISGEKAYRNIEMLCKMGKRPELNMDKSYQRAREQMIKAGWMIERDY